MPPIRVLHVVPNMHRAGLETLIMNLYRNIDRTRVQFDFLVHYRERFDYDDEIESLGGRIYRFSVREDNRVLQYLRELDAFFRQHGEYKVVHGHMESFGFMYSRAAKKHGAKTIIAHSHSAFVDPTLKGTIKRIMNIPWKWYADELFACSKKAGDFMFGKPLYTVIHNGIECGKFVYNPEARQQYRKELNIENKAVIGHIGRFDPAKNHKFLIDVFAAFHARHPESVLLLAGDGPLRKSTQDKVGKMGLADSVRFLGIRQDAAALYQAMDLFVLPSLFEGLPVVGVECQTAGLPMLASTAVTEEVEITDLISRFPLSETAEKWADKMEDVLCQAQGRRDRSAEMENAGYDINRVAVQMQEFYEARSL